MKELFVIILKKMKYQKKLTMYLNMPLLPLNKPIIKL